MAVFVELDSDEALDGSPPYQQAEWLRLADAAALKPALSALALASKSGLDKGNKTERDGLAREVAIRENPNRNSMTAALGCYPIIMSIAASIDLNTLDNLTRTCRQVREGLLQYRKMLLVSTLHCINEGLAVDPEYTLRFRARAGNWFYMEDTARAGAFNGKAGQCARDWVGGCRRCGTVVCRNCAIKPPSPVVLRDRHRRLCLSCMKAPLGEIVRPPLPSDVPLESDYMQATLCKCESEGVWLCQPCGRTIRSDDDEYKGIWRWRNQYGEVLGGVGIGIGEGDRGVVCGRDDKCCAARECEQETDCDAEDLRNGIVLGGRVSMTYANTSNASSTTSSSSSINNSTGSLHQTLSGTGAHAQSHSITHAPVGTLGSLAAESNRRTPSPALGPGYQRHEIEGIGGVVKTTLVRMIKIGACVPEWEDERASRVVVLSREVTGRVRSWCGWCRRAIPRKADHEA